MPFRVNFVPTIFGQSKGSFVNGNRSETTLGEPKLGDVPEPYLPKPSLPKPVLDSQKQINDGLFD